MKRSDVDYLYGWAARTDFPLRRAPTAVGYSNKDIYFCWLKAQNKNGGGVRQSVVDDQRAKDILDQDEILVASIALFESGTKLGPHKDPPVYGKAYRRIRSHCTYHQKNATWCGIVKKFIGLRENLKYMMLWIMFMRDIIYLMTT